MIPKNVPPVVKGAILKEQDIIMNGHITREITTILKYLLVKGAIPKKQLQLMDTSPSKITMILTICLIY